MYLLTLRDIVSRRYMPLFFTAPLVRPYLWVSPIVHML